MAERCGNDETERIQRGWTCTGSGRCTVLVISGANGQLLAVLDVAVENVRLVPGEVPGVFDGDQRVGSGNHAANERSCRPNRSGLCETCRREPWDLLGTSADHYAGSGFAAALHETFDAYDSAWSSTR